MYLPANRPTSPVHPLFLIPLQVSAWFFSTQNQARHKAASFTLLNALRASIDSKVDPACIIQTSPASSFCTHHFIHLKLPMQQQALSPPRFFGGDSMLSFIRAVSALNLLRFLARITLCWTFRQIFRVGSILQTSTNVHVDWREWLLNNLYKLSWSAKRNHRVFFFKW